MSGFYLMHRSYWEDELFSNEPFTEREAWHWLIARASFEPHRMRVKGSQEIVTVSRGQLVTAYRVLADKWRWSINRVRRFIELLKNDKKIDTQPDTRHTIITICNYDKFQKPLINTDTRIDTPANTLTDTPANTLTDTPANTRINKGKELKEGKINIVGTRFALQDPPIEWIQFCQTQRPDLDAGLTFEVFRDYWTAKTGKDATKRDWLATWRNWVRNQKSNNGVNLNGKPTKDDRAKAAIMRGLASFQATNQTSS